MECPVLVTTGAWRRLVQLTNRAISPCRAAGRTSIEKQRDTKGIVVGHGTRFIAGRRSN